MIIPCGITRRNAHSSQGNTHTHNFLKNVTLQALNLFIRHPVFFYFKSSNCFLWAHQGKEFQQKCPKKPWRFQKTTKLFLVSECESKEQPQIQTAHPTPFLVWGVWFTWRGAGYSTSITDFWLVLRRAFGDFLYNKLLWLKSAKLPLRALQNSINRNVVPVNGCNNCLQPWGIMDGEYINMRSGRAREAEQVLLIRHRDDVIWEDLYSGPGYSLWGRKTSIRSYS